MKEQRESAALAAPQEEHEHAEEEWQQPAEASVSEVGSSGGEAVAAEVQAQPAAEAIPAQVEQAELQTEQPALPAAQPELALTTPVETAAAGGEFRPSEYQSEVGTNGPGKTNGAHPLETPADVLVEDRAKDAQPAPETQPDVIAKPRGSKRGWWQQRR
jgi:hypothetical protein